MKILTIVMIISCMMLLTLFAGACDTGPSQTTGTESSTTTNQPVITASADPAVFYADMAQLCLEADLITYGEIDSVIEVQEKTISHTDRGNNIHYYTDFSFNISQGLKGDIIEEAVIHQMGAAGKMVVLGDPLFKTGEEYVLFLHKTQSGVYYVLGAYQGRFKVVDGKVFSMDNITDNTFISPELNYNGMDLDDFIGDITEEIR